MSKKTKCTPEIIERMKENVRLGFTYSALGSVAKNLAILQN